VVVIGDGKSSIFAKGSRGDFGSRWRLAPFILISIYHKDDLLYYLFIKAHSYNLSHLFILFYLGVEDRIEDFIRGQSIGISLVGAQFS